MNTINGRTPEEIKKGLSTCTQSGDCPNCPYETDCKEHAESGDNLWLGEPVMTDALAYIQQLEHERDAAVEDLEAMGGDRPCCGTCLHENCGTNEEPCSSCWAGYLINQWQWRGVEGVQK